MPDQFDIAVLPPRERAEAIDAVLAGGPVQVGITHDVTPEQIACTGSIDHVGGLSVFTARASPLAYSRTPRMMRSDHEPRIVLGMRLSGSNLIVQDGREAVIRAGDMTIVESTRPFTSVNSSGVNHHFFYVPRARLALPDHVLRGVTATRLAREDPVAGLTWTFFRALADQRALLASVPGAALMDNPAVELLRALICHQAGRADLGRESAQNTLALRVMSYVRDHLGDADLSAARIARAHNVSVRHLYAVLAREDITLGQWIRTHRLEECRLDLMRPEKRSHTIAAIARRWGLTDPTHFGRAFKSAYGMSPREWRGQHVGA